MVYPSILDEDIPVVFYVGRSSPDLFVLRSTVTPPSVQEVRVPTGRVPTGVTRFGALLMRAIELGRTRRTPAHKGKRPRTTVPSGR